jgi:hypothetical protein
VKSVTIHELKQYVNENIVVFHESRLRRLEDIELHEVLKKKNPYLFRAKNITVASDLITGILDAFLSSSEEELFGQFLEELALFVIDQTYGGKKSPAEGIDCEFQNDGIHYILSIKSGVNWGNSSQQKKQETNFQNALRVLKQSRHTKGAEAVLGCCYGKTKTTFLRGYHKIVGQNFWYFISGNENLYTDIIEPLGHKAREHNDKFLKQKGRVINLFTQEFIASYCSDGSIDWQKLVRFNSGNLNLQQKGN